MMETAMKTVTTATALPHARSMLMISRSFLADGGTDCNDGDSSIFMGASEVCDGQDNDCDGQTDEGLTSIYYIDLDQDGDGDPFTTIQACSPPANYVENDDDCDDLDADENNYTLEGLRW